jgi:hypothetical protein
MDKKELEAVQRVARKYAEYGYTVIDIINYMQEFPEERPFKWRLNAVKFWLCKRHDVEEYFTLDEMAELFEVEPNVLLERLKMLGIEYLECGSLLPGIYDESR